jgi:hypothetical protein
VITIILIVFGAMVVVAAMFIALQAKNPGKGNPASAAANAQQRANEGRGDD